MVVMMPGDCCGNHSLTSPHKISKQGVCVKHNLWDRVRAARVAGHEPDQGHGNRRAEFLWSA